MGTYHEVAFGERQFMGKTLLQSILICSGDLIVVVIQAKHVGTRKFYNLSSRSSDTATNIKDLHTLTHAHHVCKVMFVSGNGLEEALTIRKATEVEGASPAIFVEIRCKVIVVPRQGGVFCSTGLEP